MATSRRRVRSHVVPAAIEAKAAPMITTAARR